MPRELPTEPGRYYWSEWECEVEVYSRGNSLWIKHPLLLRIKLTPKVAGTFKRIEDGKFK